MPCVKDGWIDGSQKGEKLGQKGKLKNESMERRMNLATFDRRILKLTEKILKYSTLKIFHNLC